MKVAVFLGLAAGILLTVSCTTTKSFDGWNSRVIDRPFTLPNRLDAWVSDFSTRVEQGSRLKFANPTGDVFQWRQSLTDDWELEWGPLPLGVRHQLRYDSSGFSGIEIAMAPGYSTSEGWGVMPDLTISNLFKIGKDWAVTLDGEASCFLTFRRSDPAFLLDLSPGLQTQLGDKTNVAVGAHLLYTNLQRLGNFSVDGSELSSGDILEIGVGGRWKYSIDELWDFQISANEYLLHNKGVVIACQFINYW
jgi:hypothetical protein